MFFPENLALKKRAASVNQVAPAIPETGWTPPTQFPNLSQAVVLSIDTETKEKDFNNGPGWARNQGHIIGFSLAAKDAHNNRGKWYFPVAHEVQPEANLDQEVCFAWLKNLLTQSKKPLVGANLLYDLGWLSEYGIFPTGTLHDVQFAEALLHEDGKIGLDHLGKKYLGDGKETSQLYDWCAHAYGGSADGSQRGNLWRAPPCLVGPYAEEDADLPIRILESQWPHIVGQKLEQVYRLECDLIPLLIAMRRKGARIDLNRAEQLKSELREEIILFYRQIKDLTGISINANSNKDLAKLFDSLNIEYPYTDKGNPSLTSTVLNSIDHPVASVIRQIREREKLIDTFISGYLQGTHVNGRIHCELHPLRGDSNGTRSGRFASARPNLQNIPSRSELGKKIRECFIPDEHHACFEKSDYSQIEYRMLAHFALGEGSDDLREQYNTDPDTDFHDNTFYRLCPFMGWDADSDEVRKKYRKPVKNINFGLLYGMGKDKLSRSLMQYFQGNLNTHQIDELFEAYHKANPYIKRTMSAIAGFATDNGYVPTLEGRRSRFNLWASQYWDEGPPLPYDQAIRTYGASIKLAYTHRAINRVLQGSAADMIKRGMLKCWQDGIFDVTGVPLLQVHDELDFSVPDETPETNEAFKAMRRTLETAIPLRVPVVVDYDRAVNWGKCD